MRRGWSCVVAGVAVLAAACGGGGSRSGAPAAHITAVPAVLPARIVTWTLTSQFVDPATVQMAPSPTGAGLSPALRVNVYLPPGYNGVTRFPVLYLLHGADSGYADWAYPGEGDLLNTVKGFEGVIVMPDMGSNGYYANWWNGGVRGNPAWESYFLDELIPQVGQRLKILPGRRYHAIAGLSMGGEGAVFFASQLPGYFGSAASFSGVLSWELPAFQAFTATTVGSPYTTIFGNEVTDHFYWAGHEPTDLVANLTNTRVYVSVGNGVPQTPADRAQPDLATTERLLAVIARGFVSAAQAAHVPVTFRPHAGIHDWPYWRQDLRNAIKWDFFAPVASSPQNWTYLTVATTGNAWGFRFTFQAPPTVVERLSFAHGVLSGTGSGAVTITTPAGQTFTATVPFTH